MRRGRSVACQHGLNIVEQRQGERALHAPAGLAYPRKVAFSALPRGGKKIADHLPVGCGCAGGGVSLAVLGSFPDEIVRSGGRESFAIDRLVDFGEDTASLSFTKTLLGAEARRSLPLVGDHPGGLASYLFGRSLESRSTSLCAQPGGARRLSSVALSPSKS